ncbi:hypothetical protein [Pseudorhodoferax sp. Leaf274]|uniref:hypothetical protein n=1 Tax=Pseudorhodoferax sp. Leaf274 TaxID=1736318 RepID=UPI001F4687E6|nr:hypothetical protein [Pseudorhodoferax sp. Leaf274]
MSPRVLRGRRAVSITPRDLERQHMKKVVLSVGVALAQLFAVAAFAQGEVGATKAPPPAKKASPEDRAAARAERKAEGAAAIKQQPAGEVGAVKKAAPAAKVSAEDKAAARANRKAEGAAAIKQAPPGEVGPTK